MTPQQLKDNFPNASASFIEANCEVVYCGPIGGYDKELLSNYRSPQDTKPKPAIRDVAHGAAPREEGHAKGVRARVTVIAHRARLCDPDNLCPKYFIDCLRYAKIIRNDTQADIELLVKQRKVAKINLERTELIIERLEP